MKKRNYYVFTAAVCAFVFTAAWFARKLPYLWFQGDYPREQPSKLLTELHPGILLPLGTILLFSAAGIVICVFIRNAVIKRDPVLGRFTEKRTDTTGKSANNQKKTGFILIRWIIMFVTSFCIIFGGTVLGIRYGSVYFPVLSCPFNPEQITEGSCYFLVHSKVLFGWPAIKILLFFVSTIGFMILFGRIICGFLCPMGLIQEIMNALRQKTRIEGISMTDRKYAALQPVKWLMVLLMLGLTFTGRDFCDFCPAIILSPALAGFQTSIYFSGFLMIIVLIGSFFKRRFFCQICPLGFLLGLFYKITPFRIKKDCTACTECGACYEACPMGIREIYSEREKTDVTDMNCVMCGECIRRCPEDNALSMTFAGKKIYTASRKQIMAGFEKESRLIEQQYKERGNT